MENKFCFITCVNDKELYKESLLYIKQLSIPDGFSIECLAVGNAHAMTAGYNEAMKKSDAVYKIYLHQDVYILNKRFLFDLLEIFTGDKSVGMIGMAGSAYIPDHGVWWESGKTLGCAYNSLTRITKLTSYEEEHISANREVCLIDGLLIATQYDLPWREDLFDGWHFYDVSQCCEFLRKKYKIIVPNQYNSDGIANPWCLHYIEKAVSTANYDNYRNIFFKEYQDLFNDNGFAVTVPI